MAARHASLLLVSASHLVCQGGSNVCPLVKLDLQTFHPSFVLSLLAVMQVGGRRALCTDPARWLVAMPHVRPTHISAPPLFWHLLQQEHAARIGKLVATGLPRREAEERSAREVRGLLGNRLVAVASGGAAISETTLQVRTM